MKKTFFLTCLFPFLFILSGFSQDSKFTVGVVSSFNAYLSKTRPNPTLLRTEYFPSVGYGIDLSYKKGFLLFNARFLTSERKYDHLYDIRVGNPDGTIITSRSRNTARYYSLPLSLSYQLNHGNQLQIFGGLSVVAEWVGHRIRVQTYDSIGGGPYPVPDIETEPNILVGGGVQIAVRYHLNSKFLVQLEPAIRYFPQAQSSFYGKPGATANAFLLIGYKL